MNRYKSGSLMLAEESVALGCGQAISSGLHGEPERSKSSGGLPQLPEVIVKRQLLLQI